MINYFVQPESAGVRLEDRWALSAETCLLGLGIEVVDHAITDSA
jgi:hypothetical protein